MLVEGEAPPPIVEITPTVGQLSVAASAASFSLTGFGLLGCLAMNQARCLFWINASISSLNWMHSLVSCP